VEYQNMLVQIDDDHIGTITLNRPESMNTFTTTTAVELYQALLELEAEPRARVIVLAAKGKAFCAGIDVSEIKGKSAHELKQWVEVMERPLFTMSQLGKPVIASVGGIAAANGAGLAAAADLAIMAKSARLGYTAVNVGLFCLGPAVPLVRMVGRKRAHELLFYGRLIKARQALEWGMVNAVVDDDQLEKETHRWAVQLARKSPLALQLSKKALNGMADLEYHKAFDYMNEAFARLCSTEDADEGVAAFLEKRQPEWKGR